MDNQELTHWGIKGMRWGVRRYQNKDGSLTPAGKKRYDDEPDDPEAAKKAYEEGKQRAIKSGSASEVLKYKDDLTKTERDEVFNRLTWEQNMKGISDKEIIVGKTKADKLMDDLGKITDFAQAGAKLWNMTANVINAFNGPNGKTLPKIELDIKTGNKKLRKDEAAARKSEEEKARKKREDEAAEAKKKKDAETLKEAQRQVDEYNRREAEKANRSASQYHTNGKNVIDNILRTERSKKPDVSNGKILSLPSGADAFKSEGTIIGEGKSRANKFNSQTWKKGKSKADDIIDGSGLFKDITNDSSYSSTASSGRDFTSNYLNMPISGLLEEPK